MKRTQASETSNTVLEDMLPEYDFDYRKARPNRFAAQLEEGRRIVILDPDIAQVFTTSESVNVVLRALITAMPKTAST